MSDTALKLAKSIALSKEMKYRQPDMVPRFLVLAMFGLMVITVAMVAFAKLTDQPLRGVAPDSAIVAERSITLEGTSSTGIYVLDEQDQRIAYSSENKAGFIDVIWVVINRERTVQNVDGNPPLRLVRRENGHVAIIDPATDWKIELIGYGQDNIDAFARLID